MATKVARSADSESEVWACFMRQDSLFWGGDPGGQLVSVPSELESLGNDWRLVSIALIGASDVAELHHRDRTAQLWLTFDYRDGSATEGTWGYRYHSPEFAHTEHGYMTAAAAMAGFRVRWQPNG